MLINFFKFNDALKRILNGTVLIKIVFLIELIIRSKHVVIIFVIFEFHVEIFDNLIGVLYFFMIRFNFDIHFLFDFNELFYFRKILCPGRSFWKKFLKLKIFTLYSGDLFLMKFFHLIKLFVHILGMLQSVSLNLRYFFLGLCFSYFNTFLTLM